MGSDRCVQVFEELSYEERLHLTFDILKGRTRTNVGNHRKADFFSTKRSS